MLIGEKIILRPIKKEDLIFFNTWRNNIEIKQQALLHPFPVTSEMDESWYNNIANDTSNKSIFFTIINDNESVVGYTFLSNINWINRNCYFGIIIGDEQHRGKGIGKEVLKLIIDYVFNTLNLHKITLEVVVDNKSAITLYEKMGFVKEGILKEHVFIANKFSDLIIMSIIKY